MQPPIVVMPASHLVPYPCLLPVFHPVSSLLAGSSWGVLWWVVVVGWWVVMAVIVVVVIIVVVVVLL